MCNKFELSHEFKLFKRERIVRIRALRDIPEIGVKAGDLGGWVSDADNLSQTGLCWLFDDSLAAQNARVTQDAIMRDKALISGEVQLMGKACMRDRSRAYGQAQIRGQASVADTATVRSRAQVYGTSRIWDKACIQGQTQIIDSFVHGEALVEESAECFKSVIQGRVRVGGHIYVRSAIMDGTHRWHQRCVLHDFVYTDVKTIRMLPKEGNTILWDDALAGVRCAMTYPYRPTEYTTVRELTPEEIIKMGARK